MIYRILKFPLARAHVQRIMVPHTAHLINLHEQDGRVCLWMRCPVMPVRPAVSMLVTCFNTGDPIPEAQIDHYIGTAHLHNGGTVVHVFAQVEP